MGSTWATRPFWCERPKTGTGCWRPPSIRIPKPCWATPPLPLTTWRTRSRELRNRPRVIRLDPRSGLLETPALEFIRDLHTRHRFSRLVVGEDFRFGQGREGYGDALAVWGLNWALRCTSLKMCKWKANGSPVPASGRLWPTLISIWPTHSWAARMRFWDAFEPGSSAVASSKHTNRKPPPPDHASRRRRVRHIITSPRGAVRALGQLRWHQPNIRSRGKKMRNPYVLSDSEAVPDGAGWPCRWRFRLGFEERYDLTLQKLSSNKSTKIWKSHGNTMPIIGS